MPANTATLLSFPRLSFLFLLSLLTSSAAQAQTYEPGQVVVLTGDTLRGEVENSYWKEAPDYIRFRPAAGQPSTLYRPQQLRAVVFPNARYFRLEVLPVPATGVGTSGGQASATAPKADSVLAEVLVDGPAALMRVVKDGSAHFYARRTGQPAIEMSARKVQRRNAQGQQVLVDANDYRNQLTLYFLDCPAASGLVSKARFTAGDLAGVVQAYNQACGPSRVAGRSWLNPTAPARRSILLGGLLLGTRYNSIYANGECLDCNFHPWGGLYGELMQPSRNTAIYGELSATTFYMDGMGRVPGSAGRTNVIYKGAIATARLAFRFLRPLPHENQLVLGVGYELNRVLKYSLTAGGQPVATPDSEEAEFVSATILPNLTVGWRRRRLTLSLDYQMYHNNDGASYRNILFGGSGALRAGVAYRLGHHPDQPR